MSREQHRLPSIRVTVLTFFTLATSLTAALAIGLQYYFGTVQARESAQNLYTAAADAVTAEIRGISARNANLIDLLAENPTLAERGATGLQIEIFVKALQNNPLLHGIYVGHDDGSFFELVNLESSPHTREALGAMHSDRWVVISSAGVEGARERVYRYLDTDLQTRLVRSESTEFDPRERSWYKEALRVNHIVNSGPYLFAQLRETGQTASKRVTGSTTVVALDMTMRTISEYLREQETAHYGELMLYDPAGRIIASSSETTEEPALPPPPTLALSAEERNWIAQQPPLRVSNEMNWPPIDYAVSGRPEGLVIDIFKLISQMSGLQFQFINGVSWSELVAAFQRGDLDILHPVVYTPQRASLGDFSEPMFELAVALVTREDRADITDLAQLNGKRLAIPSGWSTIPVIRERYPGIEVVETDDPLAAMRRVTEGSAEAAMDQNIILRYLQRHYYLQGIKYHMVQDGMGIDPHNQLHMVVRAGSEPLLSILNKAIGAIGAGEREFLANKWINVVTDEGSADHATVPTDGLLQIAADPALQNRLIPVKYGGEDYFIYGTPLRLGVTSTPYFGVLVSEQSIVGPLMKKVLISIAITGGFLLSLVPLSWYFANPIVRPIKQLAQENDKIRERQYDDVHRVKTRVKELDELSESMVAMVAAIRAYEEAQRKLMDSFIQLIASAIDAKSPYTGGHCARVPELALMLAAAADRSDLPPFNDFQLESEDQWREYRIAAWLHDCGKITTPEHIVDKGSKLEVIYNRLHEIRMRFEVLRRDAEIDYLKRLAEDPQRAGVLGEALRAEHEQLDQDFRFIAECNVGGEFLDEEKQQRLLAIGQRTWQRHFDDRLGLSPVEELRLRGEGPSLPVTEKLLQDKPEHIIARERPAEYPPEYGINMDIPGHLYNQGEIYNLSISRGTLTAEDRFKINEHMISTISMLESLPFPEELQNVPRYASTHHETMRGDGYPRRLPGEQLSIPERILAVADVFEALTASDRPYKKAKPVSVAIDILHKMVEEGHIDRACFELFIRAGVYRTYAERFLDPSQVDEVDEAAYLAAV